MTAEAIAGAAYGLLLLAGSGLGVWTWRRGRAAPARWPARAHRLLRRPFSGVDALVVPAVVMTMILGAAAVLAAMGAEDEEMSPRVVMVQSLAVHWTILVTLAVLIRVRGQTWGRGFGVRRGRLARDAGLGVAAYLVMMPVVVLFSVVYRLLLQSLGMDTEMQDVARVLTGEASPPVRAYLLFLGMFLGPLAEECLFRGVLLPVLARRLGLLGGMLAVSAVFAGIHVHLPSLLPLFVLSMWLCVGYVYGGSIVVPVVMHMLFNAVNLVLVFTVGSG